MVACAGGEPCGSWVDIRPLWGPTALSPADGSEMSSDYSEERMGGWRVYGL